MGPTIVTRKQESIRPSARATPKGGDGIPQLLILASARRWPAAEQRRPPTLMCCPSSRRPAG
eukprot:15433970-Alexandrium_andersonii.AAC.1